MSNKKKVLYIWVEKWDFELLLDFKEHHSCLHKEHSDREEVKWPRSH